jgi:drug/metabolite transporter (DMT)-like permease
MRNDKPGEDGPILAPIRQTRIAKSPPIASTQPRHLGRVVLWMTGTLLSFSAMAVSIRELSRTLSVMEILVLRAGIGLAIVGVVAALRPELRQTISRDRFGLHLLRNTVHFASQYLWAMSLLVLPLATVFALEFTMPAWTILLAPIFLGERLTPSRIGAVILGLAGVLVILRPGLATFQPAALFVLVAALGYGAQNIVTKKLTMTQSTFAIVFWMNAIQLVLALAGAGVSFADKIALDQSPVIAVLGSAGLFAHFCLSNAFRAGDASVVVPLDFLRIPLIALVGWWFYAEPLDVFVFAGAGLIVSGIVWNLHSEAHRLPPFATIQTIADEGGPGSRNG